MIVECNSLLFGRLAGWIKELMPRPGELAQIIVALKKLLD